MQNLNKIILMGYMGSGKTTVGDILSKLRSTVFCDLDEYISKSENINISNFFEKYGEKKFRLLEEKYLHKLPLWPKSTIVALGGGTPCQTSNINFIKKLGTSFYLKASTELLFNRLRLQKHKRPLIAKFDDETLLSFIKNNLFVREKFYTQANFQIKILKTHSPMQIAKKINACLQHLNK